MKGEFYSKYSYEYSNYAVVPRGISIPPHLSIVSDLKDNSPISIY